MNKDVKIVLVGRNKKNSIFELDVKVETNLNEGILEEIEKIKETEETIVSEEEIIEEIKQGMDFFTFFDSEYTLVTFTKDGQLKSVSNKTKEDNIGKLPITIE